MIPALKPQYLRELEQVTTCSKAAREIGVDVSTVRLWIDLGHLAAEKMGGTWVISKASLSEYLNNRE